jgi:hypothetical protein
MAICTVIMPVIVCAEEMRNRRQRSGLEGLHGPASFPAHTHSRRLGFTDRLRLRVDS